MHASNDWLVWQLADSAFPNGGFAHSGGLEAAWQQGAVTNVDELTAFIHAALGQAAQGQVPFLNAVYHDPDAFETTDQLCDRYLNNHLANRGSVKQGCTLLNATSTVFGSVRLTELRRRLVNREIHAHLAVVFGLVACELMMEHAQTLRLYLFQTLRNMISAAVRLGMVGSQRAQLTQYRLADYLDRVAEQCQGYTLDDVAQSSPIIDILQGNHDRLYSRLFQT